MSRYLTRDHIADALEVLVGVHPFFGMSFLAFKRFGIPVGRRVPLIFMNVAEDLLTQFYKPNSFYDGFYNPFQSSNPRSRWVKPRYPSTSLQRITSDTFKDVFLHPRDSSEWGWHPDYIRRLKRHLGRRRVPILAMAVWLFRQDPIAKMRPAEELIDRFIETFRIDSSELESLFDVSTEGVRLGSTFASVSIREDELTDILGQPPGAKHHSGLVVQSLELRGIGPTEEITYLPGTRLNIITGDNSLGKTFFLDCVWWCLSGEWAGYEALPRPGTRQSPRITCELAALGRRPESIVGKCTRGSVGWSRTGGGVQSAPLTIYARCDGSFAVLDPARAHSSDLDRSTPMLLSRDSVWNGSRSTAFGRPVTVCRGIINDLAQWGADNGRYRNRYETFLSALQALSPSSNEPLTLGTSVRLPGGVDDIPTLRMPYGDVPITHASAGVQRILALCYLLVWAWNEHIESSRHMQRSANRKMVLLVDEVEAHLHPKWQRVIVPAIMQMVKILSEEVAPQVHLATHSPMVLASAETLFDETSDQLHHLDMNDNRVSIVEIPFTRHGKVDAWLTSDMFGLRHARSLESEEAIVAAKALQLENEPRASDVLAIHKRLLRVLADTDEFWPRWLYFAREHGVVT